MDKNADSNINLNAPENFAPYNAQADMGMRTVSQVAKLTGISARALQYYDEIGLLKPSGLTSSGYRLYDDDALQELQQILFFKELGFSLKEIKEILQKPDFDQITAFKKQKELLLLKRNRIDRLIQLLSRLERGEQCMSFKEFDLSDYIDALENFKSSSAEDVVKYWDSVENFDLFIQRIKDHESEVAKLAIKEFGSIEKYTEAMKYNLAHFSEIMEKQFDENTKKVMQQSDDLYRSLTANMERDVSSKETQDIVQKMVAFMQEHAAAELPGQNFSDIIIDTYSNDYFKGRTDAKYGAGASDYIVRAFQYYSN